MVCFVFVQVDSMGTPLVLSPLKVIGIESEEIKAVNYKRVSRARSEDVFALKWCKYFYCFII